MNYSVMYALYWAHHIFQLFKGMIVKFQILVLGN